MQYALPYLIIRVREGSGNGKERQQNASENAAVHTGKHNRDNKKANISATVDSLMLNGRLTYVR